MIVKVLIKRHIKEGKSKVVFRLLNKIRSNAIEQTGYISGETLFNHDDPKKLVVMSVWQSVENWLQWKKNADREAYDEEMKQYLEKPTEYDVYVLGTYAHQK